MNEGIYLALVRGELRGATAAFARSLLWLCSFVFRAIAGMRSFAYRVGLFRAHSAGVPVVSVGNLTTGGTGKTPLVIALCRELIAQGERVAVLARGYGAERDGELNDELRLIAREVPEAILCPGKDRVARAREAIAQGATRIVLDDGFQHRRLARDVDLVILDATAPWGHGYLLPRGLLREPRAALRRAHAVVLSRAELASAQRLSELEAEVRATGFAGPVLHMRVEPSRLRRLTPDPGPLELESLRGVGALLACGIGNPHAFAATAARLGVRASKLQDFPDHHAYDSEDVYALEHLATQRAVERVLVTGKDAVKLEPFLHEAKLTWLCLGVEARLDPSGGLDPLLGLSSAPAADALAPSPTPPSPTPAAADAEPATPPPTQPPEEPQ